MNPARKILTVVGLTVAVTLAGCTPAYTADGAPAAAHTSAPEKKSLVKIKSYTNGGRNLYTRVFEQTMPDGRIVPCIYASSANDGGGVSCDWDRAHM